MPAQWTGLIVGKMHTNSINNAKLAQKLGVSESWISMVLNGKREPKNAEARFNAALDELLAEKEPAPPPHQTA